METNMIDVNVEFDRKALTKMIKEMDLYPNTKLVVAEYTDKANQLEERENILIQQQTELQEKHVKNLEDQEHSNVADVVYLKIQAKKMVEEMEIIETLLEETKQEQKELKISYYRVYRQALGKDAVIAKGYDVTPIIDKVIGQTLELIAEVGAESQRQFSEMYPSVSEIFHDSDVRTVYPRLLDESFEFTRHSPAFNGTNKVVLERNEIQSAASGRVPAKYQAKDVK